MTPHPTHLHPTLISATLVGALATLLALSGCGLFEDARPEVKQAAPPPSRPDASVAPAAGASIATRSGADAPVEAVDSNPVQAESDATHPALLALPSVEPASEAADRPEALALIHPDDPQIDHLLEAETALAGGDAADALVHFRKSAFDLDDFESLFGIGRAARATGDRTLALRAFEAAAEKDDEAPEPLIAGARVALSLHKIGKGLRLIDRALAREPRNAESFNVRGRLWMSRQQYQKALIAFDRAIDIDPSYVWAYNNAGYIHLVTGDYEEAVDLLEVATTLEPARAYMFNNLGLAYEKLGRVEEARQTFVKSLALRPGYVNAHLNLSRVKTRLAMVTTPSPLQP